MTDMTPTQGRYLSFIKAYTNLHGIPPAESEIAKAIGVMPPSVNQMMKTLEKKGLIRREQGVARSIEILAASDTIPDWEGKRTQPKVAKPGKARRRNAPSGEPHEERALIYRFDISLRYSDPVIWRQFETEDVTFSELHDLIQGVMGWTDSHLHQFKVKDTFYLDPEFMIDEPYAEDSTVVRISDLIAKYGKRKKLKIDYEYDFGDSWEHQIVLEKTFPAEPGIEYPRCLDGEMACPPEDIGGIHGYDRYLDAFYDPDHPEHENTKEWLSPFDPEKFDAAEATRRMRE